MDNAAVHIWLSDSIRQKCPNLGWEIERQSYQPGSRASQETVQKSVATAVNFTVVHPPSPVVLLSIYLHLIHWDLFQLHLYFSSIPALEPLHLIFYRFIDGDVHGCSLSVQLAGTKKAMMLCSSRNVKCCLPVKAVEYH